MTWPLRGWDCIIRFGVYCDLNCNGLQENFIAIQLLYCSLGMQVG